MNRQQLSRKFEKEGFKRQVRLQISKGSFSQVKAMKEKALKMSKFKILRSLKGRSAKKSKRTLWIGFHRPNNVYPQGRARLTQNVKWKIS